VTPELHRRIMNEVIRPTVSGMAEEGNKFTGFLYAGLMIGADGMPRVLEFNVRFGDPETQPIMLRLRSDLVELCQAALAGHLDRTDVEWDQRAALGVVLAAGGYPGSYRKGDVIEGLPGSTTAEAQARAYECTGRIHWQDVYYRTDIGYRAIDRVT
jgi:phosphoribosylamine--glycine ligase